MGKHRLDDTHAAAVLVTAFRSVDLLFHEVKVIGRRLLGATDEDGDLPGLGLVGIFHALVALVAGQAGLFGAPEAQGLIAIQIEGAAVAIK